VEYSAKIIHILTPQHLWQELVKCMSKLRMSAYVSISVILLAGAAQ